MYVTFANLHYDKLKKVEIMEQSFESNVISLCRFLDNERQNKEINSKQRR